MYIVTIQNGDEIREIHNEKVKLRSGKVVQGINTIDSFSLSILPSNEGFSLLRDFKTIVKVYNTNKKKYEFQGRVLYSSTEMSDGGLITKEVTCESFFGYLCDSVQTYEAEKNWTVRGLLEWIVNKHNSMVESEKAFTVRTVTVQDPNDNLYCGIQRESSWDTIKKKLLDVLGGELQFEVADGTIYLDYLVQIGEAKDTAIALSQNMKSITRERDPSEYITRLFPYGKKLYEDSEVRLTIASVNDGVAYLDDTAAIAEYGIHVGVVEWDDVTEPQNLKVKGEAWLAANGKVPVRYSITALDLSLLFLDFDAFEVGNSHPVKNGLIGIDDTARIIKKNIDICEEVKSTFEIGEKFKTLTEIQQDQKRETKAAVKIIQKVNGDYVARTDYNQAVRMVNKATEKVAFNGNRLSIVSDHLELAEDGTLLVKNVKVEGGYINIQVNANEYVKIGTEGYSGVVAEYNDPDTGELRQMAVYPWAVYYGTENGGSFVFEPYYNSATDYGVRFVGKVEVPGVSDVGAKIQELENRIAALGG